MLFLIYICVANDYTPSCDGLTIPQSLTATALLAADGRPLVTYGDIFLAGDGTPLVTS